MLPGGRGASTACDTLAACAGQGLIEGKAAEGTPIICDVRDVAAAHVAAAETPAASGRYIVSQRAPITPRVVSEVYRVRHQAAVVQSWYDGQSVDLRKGPACLKRATPAVSLMTATVVCQPAIWPKEEHMRRRAFQSLRFQTCRRATGMCGNASTTAARSASWG